MDEMGREAGILIVTNEIVDIDTDWGTYYLGGTVIPDYVSLEEARWDEEDRKQHFKRDARLYDLCYWRKCQGITDEIHGLLEPDRAKWNEEWVYEIGASKIDDIIEVLVGALKNPESWDSAIWSMKDVIPTLGQNIVSLTWAKTFLEENPNAYLAFYDSW